MAAPATELRADCTRCFGLCCVAPAFSKSSDFAIEKPHGTPCPNLGDDFRCGIHTELRERGFRGCQVFECFGAGQRISQRTFGGGSWREAPSSAPLMFAAFAVARQLHEVLVYLDEAAGLVAAAAGRGDSQGPSDADLQARLRAQFAAVDAACTLPGEELVDVDVEALRGPASMLLREASTAVREAAVGARAAAHQLGPDLMGADLHGQDLRGASARGALLIAADLSGADLRHADLIGADLRDANLRGADLRGALFLTDSQLTAAQGDATTRLSPTHKRPAHWR